MSNRPPRLLLALSNDDEREMYLMYLSEHGFDVVSLQTAEGLATSIDIAPPDLIVADTRLQGRSDSLEPVKMVRRHHATCTTPLILITGVAGQALADDARAAGATEYLLKPVYPEDLLRHIRRLLPAISIPQRH